jgi:hypothetical protein
MASNFYLKRLSTIFKAPPSILDMNLVGSKLIHPGVSLEADEVVGARVGDRVGLAVVGIVFGVPVGDKEGVLVGLALVGIIFGVPVGDKLVGVLVGFAVVGIIFGVPVGDRLVGILVGFAVVGISVGLVVLVGDEVVLTRVTVRA